MTTQRKSQPYTIYCRFTAMLGLGLAAVLGVLLVFGAMSTYAQTGPTITEISPTSAPNNLDTLITITGTNFESVPTVTLGTVTLEDVTWVSSTQLTATVQWGMNPGTYNLTVVNPGGISATRMAAFTVEQAVGVWTTGGPYGGSVVDLTVSPTTSRTTFAAVSGVGFFRTQNGGDTWELVIHDNFPVGVSYGIAPTHTLYTWGDESGLWRSDDEGQTFQHVITNRVYAFVQHPQDERQIWIGKGRDIMYTADGGLTWETRNDDDFPTDWPRRLAIDPLHPSILYVAFENGPLFKTTDGGLDWTDTGIPPAGPNLPYTLAIHPFAPEVLLYAFGEHAYRSTNGGTTWTPIDLSPDPGTIGAPAFSPYISGTVYAVRNRGVYLTAISTDGGATWLPMANRGKEVNAMSMALDPTNGLPAYVGGGSLGVERSRDGGLTYEVSSYGITGLIVEDMAASPGQPETVYVGASGAGGFFSDNAGHSWQRLDIPYVYPIAVAVDPQQPERIYMTSGNIMAISQDGGKNWEQNNQLPGDPDGGNDLFYTSLAVSPNSPAVVYAGGRDMRAWADNISLGVAMRSQDYGATWAPITFTPPISEVSDIIVSPTDSNTVYVAASNSTWDMTPYPGKGIFRSTNGGETWYPLTQTIGNVSAFDLAIHPDRPQTIYATAWLTSAGKVTVFKSTDGGSNWVSTSLRTRFGYIGAGAVPPLIIDPLSPDTIYVGAPDGLFRSTDGGTTWTRAAGDLGYIPVLALAAASDDERTIIYACSIGGELAGGQAIRQGITTLDTNYVQGGVYQQTIIYRWLYLPLMLKNR